MRKSNLTYEEVIELAPKDRPFQIEEKEEVKTAFDDMFGDIIEEFEGLRDKAQDIISKYKK